MQMLGHDDGFWKSASAKAVINGGAVCVTGKREGAVLLVQGIKPD